MFRPIVTAAGKYTILASCPVPLFDLVPIILACGRHYDLVDPYNVYVAGLILHFLPQRGHTCADFQCPKTILFSHPFLLFLVGLLGIEVG